MTKVTMEYLQANGRYRQATAHTESQWPNFLINHTDKQAHTLGDSPVFPADRRPTVFDFWDDFTGADPPVPKHHTDKLVAICEDQNIWPICGDIAPDVQDRQMQFKEFAEDAEQSAVASATRAAAGNGLINAWSIASLMIFCIMSAMILLIVLQSNLAQGLLPNGKAASGASVPFMVTLGGLFLPFRRRKQTESDLDAEGESSISISPTVESKPLSRRQILRKRKDMETIRVFDELSGTVWSASLPLAQILGRLPLECRYTQEVGTARMLAMGLFGGLVFLMGVLVSIVMGWPMLWSAAGAIPLSLIGVLYGYLIGFQMFVLPPIWVVRRLYQRIPINPDNESAGYRFNYDALPVIVPEIHTKLTGMPLEMAMAERRNAAEEVVKGASQSGNGSNTALLTMRDMAVAYTPRVWRASMLYEMLKGRDIKARMKGPGNKSDKLQKISMAGMALGSVGLLIAALVFLQ